MTHELYELGKAVTQLEGWEWRPRVQSICGFDETDDDRPLRWTCREGSGRVMIAPFSDGAPEYNPNSVPDLTDDATGGVLLGLLRGSFSVEYGQYWRKGYSTPQYRIPDYRHTSGWCDHLAEACARYALARGFWRRMAGTPPRCP